MMTFPIQILPADLAAEAAALNAKLTKGVDLLSSLTDEDVDIGSTPKDVIFEQDGIRVDRGDDGGWQASVNGTVIKSSNEGYLL